MRIPNCDAHALYAAGECLADVVQWLATALTGSSEGRSVAPHRENLGSVSG